MKRVLLVVLALLPVALPAQNLVPTHFDIRNPGANSANTFNDVTVILQNLQNDHDLIIYDVEVVNDGETAVFFDPYEISCILSPGSRSGGPDIIKYPMHQTELRDFYRRKIRKKENTKTFLKVLSVGLVVLDVVQDGHDFASEWTSGKVRRSITRDILVNTALVGSDIAGSELTNRQRDLDQDLHYLPEEILREEFIGPGMSVRGKIFFYRNVDGRVFHFLSVPVEETIYEFEFRSSSADERRSLRRQRTW